VTWLVAGYNVGAYYSDTNAKDSGYTIAGATSMQVHGNRIHRRRSDRRVLRRHQTLIEGEK
jgi:hypothetical protein